MTLDTNILIAYLNGDQVVIDALSRWKRAGNLITISTISRAELLSWSELGSHELATTRDFLAQFISIPVNDTLADVAGSLRRTYPRLELPDAIIAATAITYGGMLFTRDNDFLQIHELELVLV
jgi:predicted nucleic acid-binding protein